MTGRASGVPDVQRFAVGDAHRGVRLDRFIQAMIPRMSRSVVVAAIAGGRVTLASGAEPKPARRLSVGEVVVIHPREAVGELPEPPAVLASGRGWQVLDKPAGLGTTPAARHPGRDIVSLTGLFPAHRLDRFTSGCLLVTDSPEAARHFVAAFKEGRVHKTYAAVIHGRPAAETWTCEAPLAEDAGSRVPGRMRVAVSGEAGVQQAATRFTVMARAGDLALVRAEPLTGRRHQVRVHLAHAGHPLVGDLLYGADERDFIRLQLGQAARTERSGLAPGRFLLHARALESEAPEGGELRAVSPWPADFPSALAAAWDVGR